MLSLPFSPSLFSPSVLLSFCSCLSLSIPFFSTPDVQSAELVTTGRRGVSGWSAAQAVARPPGAARRAAAAGRDHNCLLASQKSARGLCRQLSHTRSLCPLRLGFLLRLSSYGEEQGQVPGKSPGRQGSFPAAARSGIPAFSSSSQALCRDRSWRSGQAWGILESSSP